MAKLSTEERIRRIELAPKEVQTMVAKAFLRDDIDDEDIQYLFNTDGIDILTDDGIIENANAEEPEGIGAAGFIMRTTKPKNNKNFITKGAGGWNTCIKGNPMDANANVLSNCVGYASGRFNEIINLARDTEKCTYTTLNCNAENFIERAQKAGLTTGQTPRRGAIMCWQKGSLASSDGAGHVAIVERVDSNNQVYTSESSYGGTAFFNKTRKNTNGKWGINSYTFRAFIYLPDDVQKTIDGQETPITPNVEKDTTKNQIEVLISNLRVRKDAGTDKEILGMASKGYYNYIGTKEANGYTWYNITADQWIAANDGWTNIYPAIEPTPTEWPKEYVVAKGDTLSKIAKKFYGNSGAAYYNYIAKANNISNPNIIHVGQKLIIPEYKQTEPIVEKLQVGDTIKIIGTGNGSVNGTGHTAYGIGWTRTILKIWEGKKFPYQIGNNTGTTGFYKANALQKK